VDGAEGGRVHSEGVLSTVFFCSSTPLDSEVSPSDRPLSSKVSLSGTAGVGTVMGCRGIDLDRSRVLGNSVEVAKTSLLTSISVLWGSVLLAALGHFWWQSLGCEGLYSGCLSLRCSLSHPLSQSPYCIVDMKECFHLSFEPPVL